MGIRKTGKLWLRKRTAEGEIDLSIRWALVVVAHEGVSALLLENERARNLEACAQKFADLVDGLPDCLAGAFLLFRRAGVCATGVLAATVSAGSQGSRVRMALFSNCFWFSFAAGSWGNDCGALARGVEAFGLSAVIARFVSVPWIASACGASGMGRSGALFYVVFGLTLT
jgi:hypothetical protein